MMGGKSDICREGCAMSSVSMALAGKNITIDGVPSNPGPYLSDFLAGDAYLSIQSI